jgi:hypothetical protein
VLVTKHSSVYRVGKHTSHTAVFMVWGRNVSEVLQSMVFGQNYRGAENPDSEKGREPGR